VAWALSDAEARQIMRTADAKEGPRSFAEKRKPTWAGR
jgi:crotonobetainyl-CoA hydratase